MQIKKLLKNIPPNIRFTSKISYELLFIPEFADGVTLGECRFDTKQIVIKSGQSPTETVSSIIHECIHAMAMENNVELTESEVLVFEKALLKFLKLNKIIS